MASLIGRVPYLPRCVLKNCAISSRREVRESRRTARQAPITPKAPTENRFAGRFLHDAQGGRDQWRQARREHWAAREAWRHGTRAAFIPWYGAVYWPYAYSDIFDYTFWPYAYDNSYWAFVYDDFFDGIFFPYGAPYVRDASQRAVDRSQDNTASTRGFLRHAQLRAKGTLQYPRS
jgi:hypothetical protein